MKRKNVDQSEYSMKHTQQRMHERYGVSLSKDDYASLCKATRNAIVTMCMGDKSKLLNVEGPQLTLEVEYQSQPVAVVWDTESARVKTVLPESVLERTND
jgi:hypothetical protein